MATPRRSSSFGEGGRCLGLPDISSSGSIEAVVAEVQARLTEALGASEPLFRGTGTRCASTRQGGGSGGCPDGGWQCSIGDYAELASPDFDLDSLASILAGRLQRRGLRASRLSESAPTGGAAVAEFGVPDMSAELARALQEGRRHCR
jgi:hypothetical protein